MNSTTERDCCIELEEDSRLILEEKLFASWLTNQKKVILQLLNKKQRFLGDWKNCVVADDQEEHYSSKFTEIFRKFDPFLDQDSSSDEETEAVANGKAKEVTAE